MFRRMQEIEGNWPSTERLRRFEGMASTSMSYGVHSETHKNDWPELDETVSASTC